MEKFSQAAQQIGRLALRTDEICPDILVLFVRAASSSNQVLIIRAYTKGKGDSLYRASKLFQG
jgi:hypothetical protein